MDSSITASWWAMALRGVAGVIVGILCFAIPGLALLALVALFAAYMLIDGVFALVAGGRSRSWLLGIEGVLGIVAGALAIVFPGITLVVLAVLIAVWAVLTGILEVAAAVRLRRVIRNEWTLGLGGVLSIVFGVLMVVFPGAGLVAVIWLIGAYSILFGALLIGLAFRLRAGQGRRFAASA